VRTSTGAKGSLGGEIADTRRLTTDELRLAFREESGPKGTKLASADTAGATDEWNELTTRAPTLTDNIASKTGWEWFLIRWKSFALDAKGNERTEAPARRSR